jgi:hypothetical protein
MKDFRSPLKLVVITSTLNVLGNVGFWIGAIIYGYSHSDGAATVMTMKGYMYIGYLLLGVNTLALLVALFRALHSRKWAWIISLMILLAALAYEAVLAWMFYGIAFMRP